MIASVEVREEFPGVVLDALAAELTLRGWTVKRWAHHMNPLAPPIQRCSLAVLWNGLHEAYWPVKAKIKQWESRTLFCEVGWTDRTTFQIDADGVNANASWAARPLTSKMDTFATPGDLLVLLDDEHYIHEAQLSPWVGGLTRFVRLVCSSSSVPVRVRLHPERRDDPDLCAVVESHPDCTVEYRDCLKDCWEGVGAVAAIATSAAIHGIRRGLPVLCYGRAVYRAWPASYALGDDPAETKMLTELLAEGRLHVSSGVADELAGRLESHQHGLRDIQGLAL